MTRAQRRSRTNNTARASSVDPQEVAKFSALAQEWWNPQGKLAPLHKLNPVRLRFIREVAAHHFGRDPRCLAPFAGLSLIDVGCGGGLLAEPLARQGFDVLGIDVARENVAAAAAHSQLSSLPTIYRCESTESVAAEGLSFDVVLNMEVVEHVADREVFLQACASLLNPGGLMFVATINRTLKALALAKLGAEYVLGWVPPGTHDWGKFVSPDALRAELERGGLSVLNVQGVSFDVLAWDWRLGSDIAVNYMIVATK